MDICAACWVPPYTYAAAAAAATLMGLNAWISAIACCLDALCLRLPWSNAVLIYACGFCVSRIIARAITLVSSRCGQ